MSSERRDAPSGVLHSAPTGLILVYFTSPLSVRAVKALMNNTERFLMRTRWHINNALQPLW